MSKIKQKMEKIKEAQARMSTASGADQSDNGKEGGLRHGGMHDPLTQTFLAPRVFLSGPRDIVHLQRALRLPFPELSLSSIAIEQVFCKRHAHHTVVHTTLSALACPSLTLRVTFQCLRLYVHPIA